MILLVVSFLEPKLTLFMNVELAKYVVTPLGFSKQTKSGKWSASLMDSRDRTQFENPALLENAILTLKSFELK